MVEPGRYQRKRISQYLLLASLALLVVVMAGITTSVAFAGANVATVSTMHQAQQASPPNPPAVTATATPTPCVPAWTIVPSVDPGASFNYLAGVAAVSASDVWAVGGYQDASGNYDTLAERWNGTAWSVVTTPNQPSLPNTLQAVTAISANDIWAVGEYTNDPNSYTLTEHWNGTSWSIVSSPNLNTYDELNAVAGTAANDVWAVGEYRTNGAINQTLTEHWNGTAWSIVLSPNQGSLDNYLYGVAAVSAGDAWAVGRYADVSTGSSLIEHWNGTSWTIMSDPSPAFSDLRAVVALANNDAWAVGDYVSNPMVQTLVEHWNGSAWSVVSSPNDGSTDRLYGVDAVSANDAWAVGQGGSGTMTQHWDGSAWTIVPSPNPDPYFGDLYAVTEVSPNDVWTAGNYTDDNNFEHTLTEHYSGCNPIGSPTLTPAAATSTRTVTRTPTNVSTPAATTTATATAPAQASATSVSSTSTSTPTVATTPTACTITFSDVPPGSTFYPYVHCLACLGIINGYADGTFKPNNQVTRGQLSKIVSNSAGFSDPQPNQMFQDVPLGSTFQVYIGRLASRGYINGYPCGGSGEPCVPPANLPYFRPNNNATRGQISKIDANAAGFNDPPSGQQFEDVPVGSAFYTYTYRLVSRSVMSGYPCGPAGEPCLPPGNLPYFRPNNNATRGQTSKIVSNTFFPDCSPPIR